MENPMDDRYLLYIDGQWVEGKGNKTFETHCPANGEFLSVCVDAGLEDVDDAVQAAWKAWPAWKEVSPGERSAMLWKIADLIDENAAGLALIETMDNGKPIRETSGLDVPLSADHFRYFASAIRTEEGRAVMLDQNTMSIILREPLGVVGQIIPWNFPLLMAAWKIAPALAAGCCTVIKPSSATPLSLLELAKLMDKVLPPGVVNVITGGGSTAGQYMLEHQGFRKLAFTGSTEIGYSIAEAAAKKLIPATLELGGKSANIYFPDCPWEKAMEGLQIGILFNQGQVCCAGSRVFVHEDIYDRFVEEATAAFNQVKVGCPWEAETAMGSQINEMQLEKILAYVEVAKDEGARVACGGHRITEGELARGAFMRPTLLVDVDNQMRVARKRSSDRWPRSSGSRPRKKSWPWPTTVNTGWAARSGPATLTGPSGWPGP